MQSHEWPHSGTPARAPTPPGGAQQGRLGTEGGSCTVPWAGQDQASSCPKVPVCSIGATAPEVLSPPQSTYRFLCTGQGSPGSGASGQWFGWPLRSSIKLIAGPRLSRPLPRPLALPLHAAQASPSKALLPPKTQLSPGSLDTLGTGSTQQQASQDLRQPALRAHPRGARPARGAQLHTHTAWERPRDLLPQPGPALPPSFPAPKPGEAAAAHQGGPICCQWHPASSLKAP